MFSAGLRDTWRTTTFRLALLYGGMFAVGVVSLLALIYYDTARFLERQTDQLLIAELHGYQATPEAQLPFAISLDIERDVRHIEVFALFSAEGERVAGNVQRLPPELPADAEPRSLPPEALALEPGGYSVRVLRARIGEGRTLLVGREERQIGETRHILLEALAGAAVIVVIGTALGAWLSLVPIRRINRVHQVSQRIIGGDIDLRLPDDGRHDELDMLARIVNRMLDEIELRMRDIKGASDNIAHNLRTPLTRLRVTLNRLQQQLADPAAQQLAEQALLEADQLLARFRALLRISEISGAMRREGFRDVELAPVLTNVRDLYTPLAEEKGIALTLECRTPEALVWGDGALLFEAILNLVDNALKFTPAGGHVALRLVAGEAGPVVEVVDDGPGIPAADMGQIMKSFYRSDTTRALPGSGVGLSIVAAIAHLHGFHVRVSSTPGAGTHFSFCCYAPVPAVV